MKILLDFFAVVPIHPLNNIIKKIRLGSPGLSYGKGESRVVASFQHIMDPIFGGDLASFLKILTKSEKWEVLDGTSALQRQLSYHAASVNITLTADIIRLHYP